MAWTSAGSISLKTDWQYTEPISGAFFRLKHTNFPLKGQFQIAQAEFNVDNSVSLGEPLTIDAGAEYGVLTFFAPAYFANRRLAVRKLNPEPTIESQIRKALRSTLLNAVEESFFVPRRSGWSIAIEVSDVPIPTQQAIDYSSQFASLNQQLTATRSEIAALSTKLSAVSAEISQINTKVSSGTNSTSTSGSTKALTYTSDGDTNGIFYWLGTNLGTEFWTNPKNVGRLGISASSAPSAGTLDALVDRQPTSFYIGGAANFNNFITFDLGVNRALILNYYSVRAWTTGDNSNFPRNWKIRGSNDNATWTDLSIQTNNAGLATSNQWLSIPVGNITTAYRYIQFWMTGATSSNGNYLTLGELEFYGTLKTTA